MATPETPDSLLSQIDGNTPYNTTTNLAPRLTAGPSTIVVAPSSGVTLDQAKAEAKKVSGYLGLLSSYYFGGSGTITTIEAADVNTWVDVLLTVDAAGTFDYRPQSMVDQDAAGFSGTGAVGDPYLFSLAGLDQEAFGKMRVTGLFTPDIDESQLDVRLLFTPNTSGAFGQFAIAEQAASMTQGAGQDYFVEPTITFFVGDTIEDIGTAGAPDAGQFQLQIRSSVEGDFNLRGMTAYFHS